MSGRGRLFRLAIVALAAVLAGLAAPAAGAAEPEPAVPRFVSVRADEVNVRAGPGVRYPVEWVFVRRHMPVEVIGEFDTWRKVRDWQGTEGWVHQSMLSNRRMILITDRIRTLRREPSTDAPAVAHAEPGVIGRLLECDPAWCRLEVGGYRGWLQRDAFWGVYPEEIIE